MSGPIQRLLGPMKAHFQAYINMAKMVLVQPVNEADLDKEEMEAEDLIHRFSSNVALLERCNKKWTTLLHEMLKGKEKAKEEKEYLWAADGDKGSKETVASLEAHLVLILQRAERAKAKE